MRSNISSDRDLHIIYSSVIIQVMYKGTIVNSGGGWGRGRKEGWTLDIEGGGGWRVGWTLDMGGGGGWGRGSNVGLTLDTWGGGWGWRGRGDAKTLPN